MNRSKDYRQLLNPSRTPLGAEQEEEIGKNLLQQLCTILLRMNNCIDDSVGTPPINLQGELL